jgi:hypothetical protein
MWTNLFIYFPTVTELEELERVIKAAPIRLDNGVAYWKLDGYCINNTNIMRQGLFGVTKKLVFSFLLCNW